MCINLLRLQLSTAYVSHKGSEYYRDMWVVYEVVANVVYLAEGCRHVVAHLGAAAEVHRHWVLAGRDLREGAGVKGGGDIHMAYKAALRPVHASVAYGRPKVCRPCVSAHAKTSILVGPGTVCKPVSASTQQPRVEYPCLPLSRSKPSRL